MASQVRRLQAAPGVAQELHRRSRSTTISARDRERATIILLRLEGIGVDETARRLNTTPKRVSVWSRRFAATGLPGLDDRAGRGRKPSIPAAKVAQVITEATRPVAGRSRWSIRSMGRHAGISPPLLRRSCCAATRKASVRPWNARNSDCRWHRSGHAP